MPALRKRREPPRPLALAGTPNAIWDGEFWREGEFWYDETTADKAVRFFPEHLRLTKGEWANRPFILEGWQEHDIVRPLFGWKRADGTRRYRRCYVWVPRKNGKSELAAGIALLMLLGDSEEGGEVYTIASDEKQARIVFSTASTMVSKSPTLSRELECFKPSIFAAELNAAIKPLSGKPEGKHGYNASGLIGDEIHEWKDGDLYQFIHDSEAARRQPLEFLISTAGEEGTYGEEVFKECLAIQSGDLEDPETLVVIYAVNDNEDWTDPKVHQRVNPNWGKSVKIDTFESDYRRARRSPRLENHFKRYRLNMWTSQAVRWLPIDAIDDEDKPYGWDHCKGATDWKVLEAELAGRRCFGGLDLSSTTDITALTWFFPPVGVDERPKVLVRFFTPAGTLRARAKKDRLPYERWVREGALLTTPGNVMDYAFIKEQIYRDAEIFKIAHQGVTAKDRENGVGGLAIDRWNATQLATELMGEELPVVLFGQGFGSMSAPAKELERLVLCNGLEHGGHPMLRKHAETVAIVSDPAENIKPTKEHSKGRIDGIVSLCMAMGLAGKDPGEVEVSASVHFL